MRSMDDGHQWRPGARANARRMTCVAALVLVALGAVAARADWPMFRGGPALRGVAEGELPETLRLRWTFKTGDAVKSSAALVDGRVFIGSNDSNLYALKLADGQVLWRHAAGAEVESPPLVLNGRVYFGSSDGRLHAVDAATG